MGKLNLNFLENPHQIDRPNLIQILDNYAKEISEYGKEYFSHIISTSSVEGVLKDFSLYIIAPEIGFDYRVLKIEVVNVNELKVMYYTLATKQTQDFTIDISDGTNSYEMKIGEILSSNLFNASLKFLVDQIYLKRQYSDDVKSKIKVGQARIATLHSGERINVGFQRIEGDEVIYYTGKGLREMFKPNMTSEEMKQAERLRHLSEEELIKRQYMQRKKISEFKDIE